MNRIDKIQLELDGLRIALAMKQALRDKHMTQQQLADKMDISINLVKKWSTGRRSIAKRHHAKLRELLGL